MNRSKTKPAWSFLLGKELQQLSVDQHRSYLRFDGDTQIAIECQFTVTPRSWWRWWPRRGDPTGAGSASALLCLVGQVIVTAQDIGLGRLEIVFSRGQTLRLYDSNGPWNESFTVTRGQARPTVPRSAEQAARLFPGPHRRHGHAHDQLMDIAPGSGEPLGAQHLGVVLVPGGLMSPFLPYGGFPGGL